MRVVPTERGHKLAKKYGLAFCEVSAKSGHQIKESFRILATSKERFSNIYFLDFLIKAEQTGFDALRNRRERSEGTIILDSFSILRSSSAQVNNSSEIIKKCN